jgi:L-malate glycosyltransferase
MQKILFITERFPPDIGGLATSAARICKSLTKQNLAVDIFTWSRHVPSGKVQQEELSENCRLFRLGLYRNWDMTMSASMGCLEWLHGQGPNKIDVVWGHYLVPCGFLAVWFAQLNKLPSIVSARGNDLDREIFPPGDMSRLMWTLERADRITAVSGDMARKIEVLCRRSDVKVMRNAVDTALFAPDSVSVQASSPSEQQEKQRELRQRLGIADGELVLGFTGELREKKGCTFLLSALTEVRKHVAACLLVIGDVRSYQRPEIQLYNTEFPQDAERLIITGHLPEPALVAEHLSLVDIYLQPSMLEGMPNSLLEAMACGRLCIASDAGGILEIIDHGKNGFLLPRSQLNNLGVAVQEALEMEASAKEAMKQNARLTAERDFSIAAEDAQLTELMASLASISP